MKYLVPAAALLAAGIGAPASAVVAFTEFGPLPQATFGGSGIPNDNVAITRATVDGVEVTLGLSITQRYSNPAPGIISPGVYEVGPGTSIEGPNNLEGTLWNFNFYADVGSLDMSSGAYLLTLSYDFDPVSDNLGLIFLNDFVGQDGIVQSSQNLLFGFLGADADFVTVIPPFATDPGDPDGIQDFDPNALGNYQFALQLDDLSGSTSVAIEAVVAQAEVVPAPAALGLLGLGVLGVGVMRRRRRG
ncbi:MAG: PEP-CTERM sorting domain-containing protein [Pacificimonas sp.]|nr:PEP-CTERM sorting domain-containing protein [Pacificimonas sp.]